MACVSCNAQVLIEETSVETTCDQCSEEQYVGARMVQVANPACQTTLGYPPMAVRLVGGGATSHSRLVRNGLPFFP